MNTTKLRRILWLLLPLTAQSLYVPINRLVSGGVVPVSPFDQWIPLQPIWTVPYLIAIPLWVGYYLWAAFEIENERTFKGLVISSTAAMLIGMICFVFYPTYVKRPEVTGQDWTSDLLRFIYRNDRGNNAIPSGHAYITTILTLFWWRWKPRWRWFWAFQFAIIILSALLTHQHYIIDMLAGIILGMIIYYFTTHVLIPSYKPAKWEQKGVFSRQSK